MNGRSSFTPTKFEPMETNKAKIKFRNEMGLHLGMATLSYTCKAYINLLSRRPYGSSRIFPPQSPLPLFPSPAQEAKQTLAPLILWLSPGNSRFRYNKLQQASRQALTILASLDGGDHL